MTVAVALATMIGLKITGTSVPVGNEMVKVANPSLMWGRPSSA